MNWFFIGLLVGSFITAIFSLWRLYMQAILNVVFEVAFQPLVRVTSAAIAPVLADLVLDKAQLKELVIKIGQRLQGLPVTYAPMGIYSAMEQQDIVEGMADMLKAVLTKYGITGSHDIGRLLEAVANRLAV